MIAEYKAFFEAFKQGKELANAKAWKNRQFVTNHIIALMMACGVIAQAFGYYIPVDQATLTEAVGGGFAIWNVINSILVVVTSTKVGIK